MSDELPTATRVSDPGIRAPYKQENRWQAWLDVEVALARAQAELGIIPPEAAEAITRAARLRQAAPRIFVAMLGGGAGTFASLGKDGPAVQAGIGHHLGMPPMTVPSRALGDHLAENICLLGMLAATCGKIGREIYTLMKT